MPNTIHPHPLSQIICLQRFRHQHAVQEWISGPYEDSDCFSLQVPVSFERDGVILSIMLVSNAVSVATTAAATAEGGVTPT